MSAFGNAANVAGAGGAYDDAAPDRKFQYKATVDSEVARRSREGAVVQIRKANKFEQMAKRRMGIESFGGGAANVAAAPQPVVQLQDLHKMVAGVNSSDPEQQYQSTTLFRKMLSVQRNPPIQQVIDTGVVQRLVEFLSYDGSPRLQFEALWALTNIASGTSDHTKEVMDKGAIPIFIKLLGSQQADVREQAIWALGNVAGDSSFCRDRVLLEGGLEALIQHLDPATAPVSMLRNGTWALSNFCRGKPAPNFTLVMPCIQTLAVLIQMEDEDVLTDACWALSYLTDGPNLKIGNVVRVPGVVERLVQLLGHTKNAIQTPALRAVGNIVTGNEEQTQMVINAHGLEAVLPLMKHPRKGIRKEACWAISNITAGSRNQITAVLNSGVVPELVRILNEESFDVRKEAAWAISNATSGGSAAQIMKLVEYGCIQPLCELVAIPDAKVVMVTLEGLENILKVGEEEATQMQSDTNRMAEIIEEVGLEKLEDLQTRDVIDPELSAKLNKILETYFTGDDEDDLGVGMSEGGFSFDPSAASGGQQNFNFGN